MLSYFEQIIIILCFWYILIIEDCIDFMVDHFQNEHTLKFMAEVQQTLEEGQEALKI